MFLKRVKVATFLSHEIRFPLYHTSISNQFQQDLIIASILVVYLYLQYMHGLTILKIGHQLENVFKIFEERLINPTKTSFNQNILARYSHTCQTMRRLLISVAFNRGVGQTPFYISK